jgi:hypothetical protein
MSDTVTLQDHEPGGPAGDAGEPSAPPGHGVGARLRRVVRTQVPLFLELAALTSFIFARPVFASFGRSPETFLARGGDWSDVVAFALVLVLGPPVLAALVELAAGFVHTGARLVVHSVILGGLVALAAWQVGEQFTDMLLRRGGLVCLLVAAVVVALWWRSPLVGTFLRYAAVASLVFPAQFLFASPVSSIVLGGRHATVPEEVSAAVARAVGDDAPPVVVVLLDGMPTSLLLDGQGRIDADLYPHLAELAGEATWYRNHTTVAPMTLEAIPAIVSSTLREDIVSPVTSRYPHNLFTLLGGVYDVHAHEPVTGLCPLSVCAVPPGNPVPDLIDDATFVWKRQMRGGQVAEHFIPAAFERRASGFREWVAAQDFIAGDQPDLFFYHLMLPHDHWEYLPDGSHYTGMGPVQGVLALHWGEWGYEVGRQRHVLQAQAVDTLLGGLFDRLRQAGTYDDALIAVTSDHGYSFSADTPMRGVSEENYADILWTPLVVKSPGQREARIDDANVTTLDILPTIADELGIELPWDDLDGAAASSSVVAGRDPADKWIDDWHLSTLRPDDGGRLRVDGVTGFERLLASDAVGGSGPVAVWQRTPYGALIGTDVADLAPGEPRSEVVEVVGGLGRWGAVDPGRPPLELVGTVWLPAGVDVAVAANGVIAAVVPAEPTPFGVSIVHALLWPGALSTGHNQIDMYVLEGDADTPVAHPLAVVDKP